MTILRELLSSEALHSWGWRVPFLASVILGLVGLFLRKNLHESEEFVKVKSRGLTDVSTTANPQTTIDSSSSGLNGNSLNSSDSNSSKDEEEKTHARSALTATYNVMLLHWPEILMVMCVAAYWSAGYYATFIWMVYYTSDLMPGGGMEHHPWVINIAMLIVLVTCLPVGGIIGDAMMAKWK